VAIKAGGSIVLPSSVNTAVIKAPSGRASSRTEKARVSSDSDLELTRSSRHMSAKNRLN